MRPITKLCLVGGLVLVMLAGGIQYIAWTKIQREEQTVPLRAKVEETIAREKLPYTVVDVANEELVKTLYAASSPDYPLRIFSLDMSRGHFNFLFEKGPDAFLAWNNPVREGEKVSVYKTLVAGKITQRYDRDIYVPHPFHIYWMKTRNEGIFIGYVESYAPPRSLLAHGGQATFKTLSDEGVVYAYSAMRPFNLAWAITAPMLILAYGMVFFNAVLSDRRRRAEQQNPPRHPDDKKPR